MLFMTRRALAGIGAFLTVGNPIGRRDYERLLDEAVDEQIRSRFGVLCSRMVSGEPQAAFGDFKDAVRIVFKAREMAEAFLLDELTRGERGPGGPLSKP